jgi:hypothetical protein
LPASGATGAEEAPDRYEAMGWNRIVDRVEFPEEVTREAGSQEPVPLVQLDQLEITEANHLVAGMIRYEGVAAAGYLEMWTVYENEERYFTRALGDFGPMAKLSGSSDWRPVMLPFRGTADRRPVRLEVNAVLPGGGTVAFKDFALYDAAVARGGGWWSDGTGIAGVNIVGFAALILIGIAGCLAWMGKGRGFSLAILMVLIVVGIAAIGGGMVAGAMGQSAVVWAPLVVCGGIAILGGGVALPIIRRVYVKHELRRISAADRVA